MKLSLFNLHLAIENCIDIATHIVSEEGLGVPGSASEAFHRLHENNMLSLELADKMRKASGLKNLIVHEYDKLDVNRLFEIAHKDANDLKDYIWFSFSRRLELPVDWIFLGPEEKIIASV